MTEFFALVYVDFPFLVDQKKAKVTLGCPRELCALPARARRCRTVSSSASSSSLLKNSFLMDYVGNIARLPEVFHIFSNALIASVKLERSERQ